MSRKVKIKNSLIYQQKLVFFCTQTEGNISIHLCVLFMSLEPNAPSSPLLCLSWILHSFCFPFINLGSIPFFFVLFELLFCSIAVGLFWVTYGILYASYESIPQSFSFLVRFFPLLFKKFNTVECMQKINFSFYTLIL